MNIEKILYICNGRLLHKENNDVIENFTINSKDIKNNSLFFGINNGNKYYIDAINNGAKCVIVDDISYIKELKGNIILVDNTVDSMQKIASYYLYQKNTSIIAITGSVGKTSTKDMIYSVLKTKYKVYKTNENYNGQIGVPLTMLSVKNEDILVLELGTDEIGNLEKLSHLINADIAVITNIGFSHIEKFKTRKNIFKEKIKIIDCLKNKGILFLNNDDNLLNEYENKNLNIVRYGIKNKSTYNAYDLKKDGFITFKVNNDLIEIPNLGYSYVYNALVAYIIGKYYGIDIKNIKESLKDFEHSKNRMEIEKYKNITLIKDYYNSSYESTINSLEYLKSIRTRKIAILGDILELGLYSELIHEKIGYEVIKSNVDILITVGENSKNIAKIVEQNSDIKVYSFKNIDDIGYFLNIIILDYDTILIKASHSMNFEKIKEKIKKMVR